VLEVRSTNHLKYWEGKGGAAKVSFHPDFLFRKCFAF